MKKQACTCVIPFYNEEKNISNVLNKIPHISSFDRILFVDDWSTDNTNHLVQDVTNKYKHVELVWYKSNKWKTDAIRHGLAHVDTEYVFLFDADLKNIDEKQILSVIQSLYTHQKYIDMWILRRVYTKWYIKLFRRELILSGQRMLKTKDLNNILKQPIEWYQLEIAINMYMQHHKKQVFWFPFSAENTFKAQKLWFWKGTKKELMMFYSICAYRGIYRMWQHVLSFRPKKHADLVVE